MTETKMSKAKWNKAIDEWLEEQAGEAGREKMVEWPPDISGLRGGIENKIALPTLISGFGPGIGDGNPLWSNPDYGLKTRWGTNIATPTYENLIGTPFDFGELYKLPGYLTIMNSGTSREYFTVIRPYDEFTAADIYIGVKEIPAPGKKYRHFLQQIERTYYNQRGETVAIVVCDYTAIADEPGQKYTYNKEQSKGIKRPYYTQEQLDEIYQSYDDEMEGKWRRGAEKRYWEDTHEGQEIHPIIAGPFDDSESMYLFKTGFRRGFGLKYASIKLNLDRAPIDSESGEYRYYPDIFFSDHVAQEVGLPYAAVYPFLNEGVVVHGVTNWMGDDAFLRKLKVQHVGMNFMGDTSYLNGKVTRKYVDDGEHLVDIDLLTVCQDGRPITKAEATVRLLSCED